MERSDVLSFITIAAGFVLTQFSLILYLPSQHLIAQSIGLTAQDMAYALSTALCGYAAGQLWWGTLSDFFGRKKALLMAAIGGGITAFFIPHCHTAQNFDEMLAVLTFFQAAYTSIGYALIYDTFPADKTAKIIASVGVLMAITPVVAPYISLTITERYGWTMLFYALSAYSLLLSFGILLQVKARKIPSIRPKLVKGFANLMRNQAYLKYCFSLALTFSTFILFQQNAYAIFTHVMHVHAQHYAMAYALASSPYLLSTIAVRKLIQKMTIGAIAKTGTGLLATGYLMLALAALFPAHLLSTFFGWLGVMIAMAGTGIAMPSSKIGAISSIETQIGTASSGMKFIQIGSSIGIAWIAAHMMDTGNATSTLVLLAVCASIAALIHYSSQLKIQDMPYSKKEASLA